jgi:hypothetical protein
VTAVVAAVGERRRHRRDDPDRVGVLDWRSIQLFAILALLLCVSVALNS